MTEATQQRVIAALVNAHTYADAAKAAGISIRSLHRYLKRPEFKLALEAAKADLARAATEKALAGVTAQVDAIELGSRHAEEALEDLKRLACEAPIYEDRINAARARMTGALKLLEIREARKERREVIEALEGPKK